MSKKIEDILMKRDGMTRDEAKQHIKCVKEMINDSLSTGNYDEVEEIVASELGLEMDYIMDLI